ncbi:hypothetical protein N665_0733s0026 [Sinapis alba]|nr:hypothetical protein N665_0733s0026 [Sinapis alba]
MSLTSVIHNGVVAPAKSDRIFLSIPVIPPHLRARGWTESRLSLLANPSSLVSAANRRLLHIACSRGTDQEDDVSSSDDDEGLRDTRQEETHKTSFKTVALCVSTAVAFGIGIGLKDGVGKASEFFCRVPTPLYMIYIEGRQYPKQTVFANSCSYLLEQSLSVDNFFVFVLVFKYFKVPLIYQNRVLNYGVADAILFRFSLILLGTATLQRFEAVNLLLAAVLLYSSFKGSRLLSFAVLNVLIQLFSSEEDDTDLSDNFIVKTCKRFIPITSSYDRTRFFTKNDGIWKATPLLLTVAVIKLSDVDSIPAVFGVTRDPFIVLTSNLFAIVGLRSLYTLISEGMGELEYLQPSITVVLGFIGCKMILDFFGFHVSIEASLGNVALFLSTGVLLSLTKKSGDS